MQEELKGRGLRKGNLVPVLAGRAAPRIPPAFGQQSTQTLSNPSLSVVASALKGDLVDADTPL